MFKVLIKETFNLWRKKRWLKTIDKEVKQRDKCYAKYLIHDYVAKQLLADYNNRFKELVGEDK